MAGVDKPVELTFDGLVATSYTHLGFQPDPNAQSRMKWSMFVTGNFFEVMGIKPLLGRGIRPDEDQVPGRDNVVVIGNDFWKGEFGGNPSIVGRKIWLDGIQFTIIGVAPESFPWCRRLEGGYVRPTSHCGEPLESVSV